MGGPSALKSVPVMVLNITLTMIHHTHLFCGGPRAITVYAAARVMILAVASITVLAISLLHSFGDQRTPSRFFESYCSLISSRFFDSWLIAPPPALSTPDSLTLTGLSSKVPFSSGSTHASVIWIDAYPGL